MPTFLLMDLLSVIDGTLVPPAPTTLTQPVFPVAVAPTAVPTADQLAFYNALLTQWNSDRDWNARQQKEFDTKNRQALGLFNTTLSAGIWEQAKMKSTTDSRTAAEIWDWLRITFATLQFVEVLGDFCYDFKRCCYEHSRSLTVK